MALGEFDLIRRYFAHPAPPGSEPILGVGDDCALLGVPSGWELAVTVDTLVAGVHFFPDVDAESLGHKALAVNLSDLAAMAAEPRWATLALTLPQADDGWLGAFARGFFRLADAHGLALVGGDTTRGPLSITVQALGLVPRGSALRRDGACPGDVVCLSGPIGSAGLALKFRQGESVPISPEVLAALERPEPKVEFGLCLRGLASACIDISDGLAADLGHILDASGVGATVATERLPLADEVRRYLADSGDWSLPLAGGDDYQLCCTVPPERMDRLHGTLAALGLAVFPIGLIEAAVGLRVTRDGERLSLPTGGYDHFRHQ